MIEGLDYEPYQIQNIPVHKQIGSKVTYSGFIYEYVYKNKNKYGKNRKK